MFLSLPPPAKIKNKNKITSIFLLFILFSKKHFLHYCPSSSTHTFITCFPLFDPLPLSLELLLPHSDLLTLLPSELQHLQKDLHRRGELTGDQQC